MTQKAIVCAVISRIAIAIKRLLTYNHAIKAIDRKAYDKSIAEDLSLLDEMYSNHLFTQLLDWAFWCDARSGRNTRKRENSIMTDTERSISNLYLIWKEENENKI